MLLLCDAKQSLKVESDPFKQNVNSSLKIYRESNQALNVFLDKDSTRNLIQRMKKTFVVVQISSANAQKETLGKARETHDVCVCVCVCVCMRVLRFM